MSAEFEIYKYVGKDCGFGELVSSIGIKRIDQVVPAVYGDPIVPADDKTDANTYCIYRPDSENETAYSFESVFKLKLKVPPDNQLSQVRIYPATTRPDDPYIPVLKIGGSISYTRPTNTESTIAVNDIWNYSKESPFLVTVNGNVGQYVDEQVSNLNYNMTMNDIGFGNVMYMNGERQDAIPIVEGHTYTFVDKTNNVMTLTIYDPLTDLPITNSDIVTSINGNGERVVAINATTALLTAYPNGFKYGDVSDITLGNEIYILDLSTDPVETVVYDVEVRTLSNGNKVYFLNGVRNPVLNFMQNRLYQFNNINGDTDPLRFLNNNTSLQSIVESEIIIEGINIVDGGTVNEVIYVNPSEAKIQGKVIKGYQSVGNQCYGNEVTNTNTALVGNYNINTVGGGVFNPLAAGETDYVYLQLKVPGNATVGQTVPEIVIEYDEN